LIKYMVKARLHLIKCSGFLVFTMATILNKRAPSGLGPGS
jgi:hypothetical protein